VLVTNTITKTASSQAARTNLRIGGDIGVPLALTAQDQATRILRPAIGGVIVPTNTKPIRVRIWLMLGTTTLVNFRFRVALVKMRALPDTTARQDQDHSTELALVMPGTTVRQGRPRSMELALVMPGTTARSPEDGHHSTELALVMAGTTVRQGRPRRSELEPVLPGTTARQGRPRSTELAPALPGTTARRDRTRAPASTSPLAAGTPRCASWGTSAARAHMTRRAGR